jgi:alpha-glucosidase/alpha-D-xyloside xylohydrolase
MPIMRGLWLHYPDDAKAVACEDQYLWGDSVMVAPVVEKGATHRTVYLPKGAWFDFWTGERLEGGREISRPVDQETLPLYVKAGGIVPMGPVKQYVEEKVDGPVSISVYPGADGAGFLYEDDGKTFAYRKGEWMGLQMKWDDAGKKLRLRLAEGSKLLGAVAGKRKFELRVGEKTRDFEFAGKPLDIEI